MTFARRPLVIDALARWVDRGGQLMVGVDPLLRQELSAFVIRDDGKMQADAGMYDDMVMVTAIWVYVLAERGLRATLEPIVEQPTAIYSVNHIFEEAEKARIANEQRERRYNRRLARAMR
jgi:hypothetical protein